MVPDTVLRLAAIQKALEDIIRPLLPEDADFAQEQLALMIKSIALVRKQIPHEHAFHIRDAHAFIEFGRDMMSRLPSSQCTEISDAIECVEAVVPSTVPDQEAIERAVLTLRGVIESTIEGLSDPAALAAIGPVVFDHTTRQTLLERLWVVDTGFDPAPDTLPDIKTAIYGAPTGGQA